MKVLKKILNKFNGNLCFIAESDFIYYIFECNRYGKYVSYATSSKAPVDICVGDLKGYLVCFGDEQIGFFDGSILNENYGTSPVTIDLIIQGVGNSFYIWSKSENSIYKITIGIDHGTSSSSSSSEQESNLITIVWQFELPWSFVSCNDAAMFYKKFSDLIIFKGLGKIISIRDLDSYSAFVGKETVESGDNWVTVSGDDCSLISYVRTRQVWGKELENSSSSSSSSLDSSSSSSSSSSTSSTSESSSSSSSSSSSDDYWCMSGYADPSVNGTYYKNGAYHYGEHVYYNGFNYLYVSNSPSFGPFWQIWNSVVDTDSFYVSCFELYYVGQAPNADIWEDTGAVTYTMLQGICP